MLQNAHIPTILINKGENNMKRNITKKEFNNLINQISRYEKDNLIKLVSEINGSKIARLHDLKYELDILNAEKLHDSAISSITYKDGVGYEIFPKIEVSTHNCLDFTLSIQYSKTNFKNYRTTIENLCLLYQKYNDFYSLNLLNAAYQSYNWLKPKLSLSI